MHWTKKRAFIASVIFFVIAMISGTAAIVLMAMNTKATNMLSLALSSFAAALYIFIFFNARSTRKGHDKEKSA